jgi:hypothetical protein
MTEPATRPRRNPLLWLAGAIVIAAGILVTVVGAAWVASIFAGGLPATGPQAFAERMPVVFWGLIVFTIGRYLLRGARTRGVKDRFGRLLIIAGYVLLGFGLHNGLATIGSLDVAGADEAWRTAGSFLFTVAILAVPGAILAGIGTKLAQEEILLTAHANARVDA